MARPENALDRNIRLLFSRFDTVIYLLVSLFLSIAALLSLYEVAHAIYDYLQDLSLIHI